MKTPAEFTAEMWRVYAQAREQLSTAPAALAQYDQMRAYVRRRTLDWGVDLEDRRQLRAFAAAVCLVSMAANEARDRGLPADPEPILSNITVAIHGWIGDHE